MPVKVEGVRVQGALIQVVSWILSLSGSYKSIGNKFY